MYNFLFQSTKRTFKVSLMLFFVLANTFTYSQIYDWSFNPSGTGNDRANSVECDASGNSYVVGQFFGTIDVDPGPGVNNLTSAGDRDFYVAKYDIGKNLMWAFKIGGATADIAYALTIDALGNIFVVGVFGNTVDFDPGAGVSNLVANGTALNGFVAKYNNAGTFMTAYNIGFGATASSGSSAMDIGIDNSGNFFVVGTFSGTADLNPSVAVNNVTAAGSQSYFVSKFNSVGAFLFGFKLDYTWGSAQALAIAVLPSGDFYITGVFGGTTDFDPSASTFNLTALGSDDAFLVKYTAAGNFSWAFKIGAANVDCSRAIETDSAGNVYITGIFVGTVDFDPSAGLYNLTSSQDDIFVAKYTSAGSFSWAFRIGGALSLETGTALYTDSNDELYVTGYFLSTNVDFDPGAGAALHSAATGIDIFVAKYSSMGNYVWSFSLSDNAGSQPTSIAANSLGIHLAGYFSGTTIDCDPSAATANLTQVGGEDAIVARYSQCASPSITASPASTLICASANTSFTTTAVGSGLTYQWQVNQGSGFSNILNGGVYSGATSPTLILTGPSAGMNNWLFQCVVSGLCSPTATSAAATLTVISTPSAPGPISGNPVTCSGATIIYSVAAVPGATSYSWALPSGWSGITSLNTSIATAGANSGVVSVSASNSCGTSLTTTLSVFATSAPILSSSVLGNTLVCENTIQQYSISPVAGATSYSWSAFGGLSGFSSTNVINASVNSPASGVLTVIASNSCGISPSQSLAVNINPSPTISVNSGSVCAGQSFTILPSGANTFTFSSGSAIVSPTASTSYSVVGTNSFGCVSSLPAISNVSVNSLPLIITSSSNSLLCIGQSATIIVTGANTYTWSPSGSGNTIVVSPTLNTSYSVTGTDINGCTNFSTQTITVNILPIIGVTSSSTLICIGQTATLFASGASTYSWSTSATSQSIIISPTINVTYTITGTDANGCVDTVSYLQNVSACTVIEDLTLLGSLSGFPNPFYDKVTLTWSETSFSFIEVYNVIGELIYGSEFENEKTITIDLGQQNSGVYLIRLYNNERQFAIWKAIKQ